MIEVVLGRRVGREVLFYTWIDGSLRWWFFSVKRDLRSVFPGVPFVAVFGGLRSVWGERVLVGGRIG